MIIKIENLRLRTIVGIFDWEKEKKQDITINIEMDFDGRNAAISDNIDDTIDYKSLNKRIISFVEEGNFNLLEKISSDIADIIMEDSRVISAKVKVDKPGALRFADSVSVSCYKEKDNNSK